MTRPAATFSEQWLARRERFDLAARDRAWPVMANLLRDGPMIRRVIDLGCGSGANQRFLQGRLKTGHPTPGQHGPDHPTSDPGNSAPQWLLIDADPQLLDAARRRTARAVMARGIQPRAGDATATRLQFQCADLSDLSQLPTLSSGDLVSASALIDLVSRDWLSELIRRCHAARAMLHLALTYDGRSSWRPAHPQDAAIVAAFNRDQQTDKGFGRALGPAAAATALALLEEAGYRVGSARSDWVLDARRRSARRIIAPLITDHARIARLASHDDPDDRGGIEAWAQRRRQALRTGRLQVRIGHVDLIGLPAQVRKYA